MHLAALLPDDGAVAAALIGVPSLETHSACDKAAVGRKRAGCSAYVHAMWQDDGNVCCGVATPRFCGHDSMQLHGAPSWQPLLHKQPCWSMSGRRTSRPAHGRRVRGRSRGVDVRAPRRPVGRDAGGGRGQRGRRGARPRQAFRAGWCAPGRPGGAAACRAGLQSAAVRGALRMGRCRSAAGLLPITGRPPRRARPRAPAVLTALRRLGAAAAALAPERSAAEPPGPLSSASDACMPDQRRKTQSLVDPRHASSMATRTRAARPVGGGQRGRGREHGAGLCVHFGRGRGHGG